jgi:hypothetical protein
MVAETAIREQQAADQIKSRSQQTRLGRNPITGISGGVLLTRPAALMP